MKRVYASAGRDGGVTTMTGRRRAVDLCPAARGRRRC